MTASQNIQIEGKTYAIRLRSRGQMTVPQAVRDKLNVADGDILTLVQMGAVMILTPKRPQVPPLADKFAAMMENENVNMADLLQGLQEERELIRQEQQTTTNDA